MDYVQSFLGYFGLSASVAPEEQNKGKRRTGAFKLLASAAQWNSQGQRRPMTHRQHTRAPHPSRCFSPALQCCT